MRRASILLVALGAYAAFEIPAAAANADRINPDAVCYLRNALYWTQGRFLDALSGYWSPMLSWCVAPLLMMKADALHAAYLVLALWGALLVVASWWMLGRLGEIPAWLQIVAMVLVAESVVTWSATAFPDVILAAGLMAYAAAALSPRLFEGRAGAIVAGVLAGLAYLGKAYGFPFFLVHWPATVALFAWRRGVPRNRALATAITGAVAFGAVALPWAVALSVKFKTPTYGLSGGINHAIIGPNDDKRDELWEAIPGRVTVWEIPETRRYRAWSMFDDRASFVHQVSYSWRTLKEIRGTLQRFDALGIGLVLVLLGPFVAAALARPREEIDRALWAAMTVLIYALPFAFVYFTYRYTAPWLKPLTILFALTLTWRIAERLSRPLAAGLVAGVVASFLAHANVPFTPYTVEEPGGTSFDNVTVDSTPHRGAADRLRAAGIGGPIASTGYWAGMYIGYFLDAPFVGSPAGTTPRACEEELEARGVQTFVMDRTWRFAPAFAQNPGWRTAATIHTLSGEVWDVLVRGQSGQVYTQLRRDP
jgi:4-amino-4-deoxy-L-arabinose transferase-like glycosyltransferase